MSENNQSRIQEIIDNGYEFKIGDYFTQGYNIFTKNPGVFIGWTMLFIASMGIAIIPIIGILALVIIILPAMTMGLYYVANKVQKGEQTSFSDLFQPFSNLGKLVPAWLALMLLSLIVQIPYIMSLYYSGLFDFYKALFQSFQDPDAMRELMLDPPKIPYYAQILSWAGSVVSTLFTLVMPLSYFHNLGAVDAVKKSYSLVAPKILWWFLLNMICGLIMAAGIIALCIGFLATVPIGMCIQYAAFADVTKLNESMNNEQDINEHLVL